MIDYVIHEDGMLIIGLNVNNNYLEVEIKDDTINFIDGYAVIEFKIDKLCFVSGIIDNNYNVIAPFTISEDELKTITLFKNKKAIYETIDKGGKQKFLLIDLSSTKNTMIGKRRVSLLNVLMEFDGYDDLNDEMAMILKDNKYVILNVSKNTINSLKFDDVLEVKNGDGSIDMYGLVIACYNCFSKDQDTYYIDEEFMPTYNLYFKISRDGKINNPIYFKDNEIWIPEEKMQDLDYIASIINDNFICPRKEDSICKVLQ